MDPLTPEREARVRTIASLAVGVLGAASFLLDMRAWWSAVVVIASAHATIALLHEWRGLPRDMQRGARDTALSLGVALGLPLLLAVIAAFAGTWPTLARAIAVATPRDAVTTLSLHALVAVLVVLLLDGLRERRAPASDVASVLVVVTMMVLAQRIAWIGSVATLPVEAYWSEAPFLVNALKLDAGALLYGPFEDLDSYTYSPAIDLVHHALLRPIGLELSLYANRVLVLVAQIAAAAIAAWATWPSLASSLRNELPRAAPIWAGAVIAIAALANMLAPAVHPDHAQLLLLAIALALVLRESSWPRALWWAALVLLTPIAFAFKASGAGIGIALGVVMLGERRWREVGALASSAVLMVATIPLFDATLGHFHAYAFGVQSSHPIVWSRLKELPLAPLGITLTCATFFAVVYARRMPRTQAASYVAAFALSMLATSLPAYLKYGGRDNNLAPAFFALVLFVLLRSMPDAPMDYTTAQPPARLHPALPPALALALCLIFQPPAALPSRAERDAFAHQAAHIARVVKGDDDAGGRTLLLVHTSAWIAAGHRDVPRDRFHSAIELFYGARPEAEVLFAHIADGRYRSVVVGESQLRGGDDEPRSRFASRLGESLAAHYTQLETDDGVAVYRRR